MNTDNFLCFVVRIFLEDNRLSGTCRTWKVVFYHRHKTNRRTGKKTLNANDLISRRQRILKSPPWISIFFSDPQFNFRKRAEFGLPVGINVSPLQFGYFASNISPPSSGWRKARFNDVYLAKVALVRSLPRKEWFSFYALWVPPGIVLSRKFIKSQISRFIFGWVVCFTSRITWRFCLLFYCCQARAVCFNISGFNLGDLQNGHSLQKKNNVDLSRVCLSICHH